KTRIDGKLKRGGALGTKRALVDRTVRIAFNIDDLLVAHADNLAAADGTVRADARHFPRLGNLEIAGARRRRPQIHAQAEHPAQREAAPRGSTQKIPSGEIVDAVRHAEALL